MCVEVIVCYIIVVFLRHSVESLKATAAVSWSTSSPASSMKDSFSPCVGLLDENCGNIKVFLPDDDDEERPTFKKECEATDALVRIRGMLLDVVQILCDCHEMRQRHIYGRSTALVRHSLKPNAKRKLTSFVRFIRGGS